jgi:GH25 family lysozyme M1 (1,4-beta-N-acetylmuramidase)
VRAQLSVPRGRAISLLLLSVVAAVVVGSATTAASRPHVYRRSGIDVSHWQGRIDWAKVAASGVDFAIIKATDGSTGVDEWYHRNRNRARRAGLYVTAYHFAHPGLSGRGTRAERIRRDARTEAHHFLRNANLSPRDLIPALDLELTGGLRSAELQDWTMTFLVTVQHAIGAKPMVYSTAAFWRSYLGDTPNIARAGFGVFWVAHWDAKTPDVPGREWLGRGWTFWQWTDCGRVQGIYDCVDRNTYTSTRSLKTLRIRHQQVRHR